MLITSTNPSCLFLSKLQCTVFPVPVVAIKKLVPIPGWNEYVRDVRC